MHAVAATKILLTCFWTFKNENDLTLIVCLDDKCCKVLPETPVP